MAKDTGRWTLEDLIDFESEIAAGTTTPPEVREAVVSASRGQDGAAARRAGFRIWLEGVRSSSRGGKFGSALALVGSGLALVMFLAGISGVIGMVDRTKVGIHITLFLAILIGGQWLVLMLAAAAWWVRGRAAEGFSGVQALIGKLARRLAGERDAPWWNRLMNGGSAARTAILWRLARMVQAAGISFNLGVLVGLAGLVMVKHVGFFWETTTEVAMFSLLAKLTWWLSLPWSAWWQAAVPNGSDIRAACWIPGHELASGPAVWWQFLLMTALVWGLLPRLLLWCLAWNAGRRALGQLDFQARSHRALWRDLTVTGRVETDDKPLDGVLVLDVGGSRLTEEGLRSFLLRRMRVHPTAWHSVAVLDPGAEAEASRALSRAPAGVVLLAEGWALSPARMNALHAKIRANAGHETPVKFLIANSGPENTPLSPNAGERREWERFVDSLRDPEAEVFFYENPQPAV